MNPLMQPLIFLAYKTEILSNCIEENEFNVELSLRRHIGSSLSEGRTVEHAGELITHILLLLQAFCASSFASCLSFASSSADPRPRPCSRLPPVRVGPRGDQKLVQKSSAFRLLRLDTKMHKWRERERERESRKE